MDFGYNDNTVSVFCLCKVTLPTFDNRPLIAEISHFTHLSRRLLCFSLFMISDKNTLLFSLFVMSSGDHMLADDSYI